MDKIILNITHLFIIYCIILRYIVRSVRFSDYGRFENICDSLIVIYVTKILHPLVPETFK